MTIDDIKALIAADESRTLELKKTTGELKDGMHSARRSSNGFIGRIFRGFAVPDSFKEGFELRIKVNSQEGSCGDKQHAEYRNNRGMNFTHRRHIESQHDNDHTENDEHESKNGLGRQVSFEG